MTGPICTLHSDNDPGKYDICTACLTCVGPMLNLHVIHMIQVGNVYN